MSLASCNASLSAALLDAADDALRPELQQLLDSVFGSSAGASTSCADQWTVQASPGCSGFSRPVHELLFEWRGGSQPDETCTLPNATAAARVRSYNTSSM